MEAADRQITPRHWISAIGDETQRQQLAKNLKREEDVDNREPQIHAGNRDGACCGNRQLQTGKNPPGRSVRSEYFVESR